MENSEEKDFGVSTNKENISIETPKKTSKSYASTEKKYDKKKNTNRIVLIASIICASLVLLGGVCFGILFFISPRHDVPAVIPEENIQKKKIYATDFTGTVEEQKDNGQSIEEIIKLLDKKIEEIKDPLEKEASKNTKIYALYMNDYFDAAKSELKKLEEKEPNMSETCVFNRNGLNIAEHFNDKEAISYYTEKINAVCGKGRG